MTNSKGSTTNSNVQNPVGGLVVNWLLGDDPTTIKTKSGEVRTVIELRDPARLSRSITIWLDGEGDALNGVRPGSLIAIHLQGVRSGGGRGELVAEVDRQRVEAAFAQARQQS